MMFPQVYLCGEIFSLEASPTVGTIMIKDTAGHVAVVLYTGGGSEGNILDQLSRLQ